MIKNTLLLPSSIFFAVWVVTIVLYSLGLTTNLVPLNSEAIFFLLSNLLVSVVLTIFFLPFTRVNNATFNSFISAKTTKKLFFIWGVMLVPDVLHSGSIPILMAISGAGDYTHFGIPTYHGFVNLIFFLVFPTVFFHAWGTKKTFFKVAFLLMTAWEVVVLRRGILLGGLMEVVFVFLFYSNLNIRAMVKFIVGFFCLILLFGYSGDLRGVENPYSYLINRDSPVLDLLPSGFTWFYVYLTSGLSNLAYNISQIIPVFDFSSFQDLFPSVIRNQIYGELGFHDSMVLVDESTNVSTMYELLYPDIGVFSLLILFSMLFFFNIAYIRFLRGGRAVVYAYLIACQCVVFSTFYNLFFIQTYFLLFFSALFFSCFRFPPKKRNRL